MKLTKRTLKLCLKPIKVINNYQLAILNKQLSSIMQKEGGIGLAANQIGLRDRCFVMNINGKKWFCANPAILKTENDIVEFDEGCLSFPGDRCIIKRPDTIHVTYIDSTGNEVTETLSGLESRCFQHELDHLNGITMWDRYKEQNAK